MATARVAPSRMYDFYATLGSYGVNPDVFTADPEQNLAKLGPLGALHVFASGLWIQVLFMSPMLLVKARRVVPPNLLLAGLGVGVAARMAGKL